MIFSPLGIDPYTTVIQITDGCNTFWSRFSNSHREMKNLSTCWCRMKIGSISHLKPLTMTTEGSCSAISQRGLNDFLSHEATLFCSSVSGCGVKGWKKAPYTWRTYGDQKMVLQFITFPFFLIQTDEPKVHLWHTAQGEAKSGSTGSLVDGSWDHPAITFSAVTTVTRYGDPGCLASSRAQVRPRTPDPMTLTVDMAR
jgi:hypothetical protein